MPSPWHDAIVRIFREEPGLAPRILREWAGADVPASLPSRLESPAFNDRPSTDFSADTLVVVSGHRWDPVHVAVVEAQQEREDSKLTQLARYAAAAWLMARCRVDVLVICPDQAVADWYARPVTTTLPGYTFRPVVAGPALVPAMTDPAAVAGSPGIGAMSVAVHGHDRAVAEAFVAALVSMPPDRAPAYYESAYGMSPVTIRAILEELMSNTTWPVYSPFAREHFGRGKAEGLAEGEAKGLAEGEAKGLAEGEAEAILLVLEARRLEVTDHQRAQITGCTDLAQLKAWVKKAVTVQSTDDLFA